MTAKGLCSNISSSRFCCPLPVTMTSTGVFREQPSGSVKVPLRRASPLRKLSSSCVYGNGATGVCGRFNLGSPGVSVSGNAAVHCLNVPTIFVSIQVPSKVAPAEGIRMITAPVADFSTWMGMSRAPWSGESMVGFSPSRWNTREMRVPCTSRGPDQVPVCAPAEKTADSSITMTSSCFMAFRNVGGRSF